METNFTELKDEILDRARRAEACREQYRRAAEAETVAGLLAVVKDNFGWVVEKGVLTADLVEKYRDEFRANDIFANEDSDRGYILAYGDATVKAYGDATVEAYDNATVEAYDKATVYAGDNTTVEAYDTATVTAYGNATVTAYGNATVTATGTATVEAYHNAYCVSYLKNNVKISGQAIYRVISENKIYTTDNVTVERI